MILEAGEVPQPSIFMEMVFLAAVQHDYERAVNLITVMGHASFQVTEKQWTELFRGNSRRIPGECCENLLVALRGCPLQDEATVTNLSRALSSLTKSVKSREISSSSGQDLVNSQADTAGDRNFALGEDILGDVFDGMPDRDRPDNGMGGENRCLAGGERGDGTAEASLNGVDSTRGENPDLAGEGCSDDTAETVLNGIDSIISTFRLNEDFEEEGEGEEEDVYLGSQFNSDEDEDEDEDDIDSGIPSAEEILQMWKENRHKDDSKGS